MVATEGGAPEILIALRIAAADEDLGDEYGKRRGIRLEAEAVSERKRTPGILLMALRRIAAEELGKIKRHLTGFSKNLCDSVMVKG